MGRSVTIREDEAGEMLIRIFLENAHYKQFYYLILNFFFIII